MKVAWITRAASFAGGAERHVAEVAELLSGQGVDSWLLHDPNLPAEPAFTGKFRGAFPWADLSAQVAALKPDVLYLHRVAGRRFLDDVAATRVPAVRFFHDHQPFCLRGHKYTTVGHETCTRTLGPHCVPCLGFLNRADGFPPVRLRTLGEARDDLEAHRRLAAFAVGSAYMKDHVVAHGFSPAAVRVLPMFVPPPGRQPPARRAPGSLLFVGALLRGKGLDVLLDALLQLPGARLRVAGSGHQAGLFQARAEGLGIADRVDFLGALSRDALDAQYRAAACVVVPSREPETFSLVGPEAFRHGTPVVASRVGGTGEWLLEGRTGLGFPSGDAAALAAAVRQVLDDPDRAAAMGRAGRDLVAARFTPDRHAAAVLDLLGWVAAEGRRAA